MSGEVDLRASSEVDIDCSITGLGWMTIVITASDVSSSPIVASYLTDALGDLLRAILVVATSGDAVEVEFEGEPQIWVLSLIPDQQGGATIRIRFEGWSEAEDVPLLYEARCNIDALAKAAIDAAESIWTAYGVDGYNQSWHGDKGFPLRAMAALKAAVEIIEPSPPDHLMLSEGDTVIALSLDSPETGPGK